MSAAAATAPSAARPPSTLEAYRDDGPLARALGARLGPALKLPVPVFLLAGVVPLLLVIALTGEDAPLGLAAAVVVLLVLVAAASRTQAERGGLRWTAPPALRLAEYAGLLWLGAQADGPGVPAAFALLGAVAFRHYDLVYRLRHRGVTPPRWLGDLAGGWDGRLVVALLLLALDALPAGLFVIAAVLGVVFVVESAAGWTGAGRAQRPVVYEDEEDEGQ